MYGDEAGCHCADCPPDCDPSPALTASAACHTELCNDVARCGGRGYGGGTCETACSTRMCADSCRTTSHPRCMFAAVWTAVGAEPPRSIVAYASGLMALAFERDTNSVYKAGWDDDTGVHGCLCFARGAHHR